MRLILDRALQQQHLGAGGFTVVLHSLSAEEILLVGKAKIIAARGRHTRGGRANAAPRTGDDHKFS